MTSEQGAQRRLAASFLPGLCDSPGIRCILHSSVNSCSRGIFNTSVRLNISVIGQLDCCYSHLTNYLQNIHHFFPYSILYSFVLYFVLQYKNFIVFCMMLDCILFIWFDCFFTGKSRIFHFDDGGQHYGDRTPAAARVKHTTIRRSLEDGPTHAWRGSRHDLKLGQQRRH